MYEIADGQSKSKTDLPGRVNLVYLWRLCGRLGLDVGPSRGDVWPTFITDP